MIHYRHDCTTRGHGAALMLAGLPAILAGWFLWTQFTASPATPTDEPCGSSAGDTLGLIFVSLLLIAFLLVFAMGLRHVLQPRTAYVEITDDTISWRDLNGFTIRDHTYPLATISALRRPYEAPDVFELADRTTVAMPYTAIGNHKAFEHALRTAAPHILIEGPDTVLPARLPS